MEALKSVLTRRRRSRGAVAVQVAFMMAVLLGFAALAFDVGAMYNTKADLQRTADAAALAAAGMLSQFEAGDPMELARAAAEEYTAKNAAFGKSLSLAPSDVEFGRAVLDPVSGSYVFSPTQTLPDAVRIRVRMTADSPNGPMPLYFARIFGKEATEVWAEAVAVMVPRDIAIVADLSGSHNDDSAYPNDMHPVWDALSKYTLADPVYGVEKPHAGADEENGGMWGADYACAAGDAECVHQRGGPAWGLMKELQWGADMGDGYSMSSDPGLVYLPKNQNWSNALVANALAQQGYIPAEVDALMSAAYDGSGSHPYRTAVALGLARWNSGIPGGLWAQVGLPPEQSGNGNAAVGSTELTYTERFGDRSMSSSASIWKSWISSNGSFGYRYGVKGFVQYLQNSRAGNAMTPELTVAPEQPMQAVKDAVGVLVWRVEQLDTDDQMSLEIYGTTARHEVDLTRDYFTIASPVPVPFNPDYQYEGEPGRLTVMQAAHYDSYTNMGGGIRTAIQELNSSRHRPIARKIMIVLTDGNANVNEWGQTNDYTGGRNFALKAAQEAAEDGIMLLAVSVGNSADTSLMQQIAQIGGGKWYDARGSVEQYSQQLMTIFDRLGGVRPVELIK